MRIALKRIKCLLNLKGNLNLKTYGKNVYILIPTPKLLNVKIMKTLLIAAAFLFSISAADASESFKKSKHSNIAKSKIVYKEPVNKGFFASNKKDTKVKKVKIKPEMFAGDGSGPSNPRVSK